MSTTLKEREKCTTEEVIGLIRDQLLLVKDLVKFNTKTLDKTLNKKFSGRELWISDKEFCNEGIKEYFKQIREKNQKVKFSLIMQNLDLLFMSREKTIVRHLLEKGPILFFGFVLYELWIFYSSNKVFFLFFLLI